MKPVFYPYKMKSSSAKTLAKEFGVERVRHYGHFRNNYKRPIINWGNTTRPDWMKRWSDQVILNKPEAVEIAANKLLTFQKFSEHAVKCPEWTTSIDDANEWLDNGETVVERETVIGKGGQGIIIVNRDPVEGKHDDAYLGKSPLYTKYFKKKQEFRVHVVRGKIISFAEKKKKVGEKANYQIRNADNGWVFCHENVILPEVVKEESIKAVAALELDFGAVDIGYNVKKNEPCVFEVNTAPGIEGSTIEHYKQAFEEVLT